MLTQTAKSEPCPTGPPNFNHSCDGEVREIQLLSGEARRLAAMLIRSAETLDFG